MTDLREIQKSSQFLYDGQVLHVYRDVATLPDGSEGVREVVRHIGAVAIVALTDDGRIVLERQFRYPVDRVVIELPAGKLDDRNEDRLEAAKREFCEETGYTADEWVSLGDYLPAAAYSDERLTIYLAKGLHRGEQSLDEDEFLEVFLLPFEEAVRQCADGRICDGKTVTGILRAQHRLRMACEFIPR